MILPPNKFVALLAAASLLAACDRKASVASDSPYADIVAKAMPKIESEVGLKFKTTPTLQKRSKAEVRQFLMKQLTDPKAKAMLDGQTALYRGLGLISDTLDVGALLQRLLEEQIVGYYDPGTKVLYVVDGTAPSLLTQTITHELVHALQDQYIKIDSIQGNVDDSDRQSASQAVLEGQAVFVQLAADPNAGPMLSMPGGWDRIRDVIKDGQTGMPVFASAPRIIREGLLFPYLGGADFTRRFFLKRKPAELLTDLPVSTRQILNDDAYFDTPRNTPSVVKLPAPRVGQVTYSNTLGEFETRLVLVQHLKDEVIAKRAAAGVDGDRVEVIKTPDGDAIAWASVWDTAVDAGDFFDQMGAAISKHYEVGSWEGPPGSVEKRFNIPAAGKRAARVATLQVVKINGRPLVLYLDVPASIGVGLINASAITISN
ncbi:MAG: hypothetical protein M3Y64_04050 [Gemmatimonadota bacterium]|nr:hypothetical protein [Gemmatimonadota bacterium]